MPLFLEDLIICKKIKLKRSNKLNLELLFYTIADAQLCFRLISLSLTQKHEREEILEQSFALKMEENPEDNKHMKKVII